MNWKQISLAAAGKDIMMRYMKLGKADLEVPVIAVGCMRMRELSKTDTSAFINNAIDLGLNFFDHADVYGGGTCETKFGEAYPLTGDRREKIILQSKCSIAHGKSKRFDFSKEYILSSVDGILSRLNTDYLDVLLLHRPDALVEPDEVAEAFDRLQSSGKVRHFGVSNQNPMQIQLLQKSLKQPIVANQLQLSIVHAGLITSGIHVNMTDDGAIDRDGDALNFCRLNDITIQCWSPFQVGFFEGTFIGNPDYADLNQKLDEIGARYQVNSTTMALAWLLRHPAGLQPVTGTMKQSRLADCAQAADIRITRDEWYEIYLAAGNILP